MTGVVTYRDPAGELHDLHAMPAPALRALHRSDWGFVQQDAARQRCAWASLPAAMWASG